MKRITFNSSILFLSVAVLHTVAFVSGRFLIVPHQVLVPSSLSASVIMDLLVLCILPGLLVTVAYRCFLRKFAQKCSEQGVTQSFIGQVLYIFPAVLFIAVTVATIDTLRHSMPFTASGFWGIVAPIGTVIVFPNAMQIWVLTAIFTLLLTAVRCALSPLLATENDKIAKSKNKLDQVLFYFAAAFMPSILLFNLYNANWADNPLAFSHILIFAGVLAVAGILLYFIFERASGSAQPALLLFLLFWICFWFFEAMYGAISSFIPVLPPTILMMILISVLIIGAILFRKFKPRFLKPHPVYRTLIVGLFVIFILNLAPGLNNEIVFQRARAAGIEEGENAPFYIKREFYIDESLPTPDIYWLHLDGMMSLETMEGFWGVSQDHFREELASRGFLVYANAELNAGATRIALPALFSPAFYDSFWGEQINQADSELRTQRVRLLTNELQQVGLSIDDDVVPYYEFFVSFFKRGYEIDVRSNTPGANGLPPQSFEHIADVTHYNLSSWNDFVHATGALPELLSLTTPLNVSTDTTLTEHIRSVICPRQEVTFEPLARLVWRIFMDTHMGTVWRHDPTVSERDSTAIHIYPMAYAQMEKRVLNFVDSVLEENPNAVIVLQSDHGFHLNPTQQFMLDQGYPLETVLELIHSVFSAVRIPPEYGGLDEPIAPLNISRELVNRFVGQNYELLP